MLDDAPSQRYHHPMRTLVVASLALACTLPAAAGTRLPKPPHGFQMKAGTFTVQPQEDLEVCEYRRLPNKKAMDVTGMRLIMPPGAHHFVIWAYGGNITDDSRFPKGPVDSVGCTGVSPDEGIPQVLIPLQTPNTRFDFPPASRSASSRTSRCGSTRT